MILHSRIRLISIIIIVVALSFIVRLYFLQIVNNDKFIEKAERQYTSQNGLFDRGTIFFSNKDNTLLSAANLKTGYIIAITPNKISDVKETYDNLSKTIDIDSEKFFSRASKKDDPYEEIATQIEEFKAMEISEKNIKGVVVIKERWRYYPNNTLASQTLGMVGVDGKSRGYGLETSYDNVLTRNSKDTYNNFFAEIFSTLNKAFNPEESLEGDIVTTIEPEVEKTLENEFDKVYAEYSPQSMGGIIMSPKTGEIYALGAWPTFNPNDYGKEKMSTFPNPIIKSRFEMGSIVKAITMASGLDAGVVTAKTTYNDKGFIKSGIATIYNYDKKARGVVPMQEVLNQSLNTGMAFVVDKLGNKVFADYLIKFGFGEKTGIDLPDEISGDIRNLNSTRDVEYITSSFGQGITLTPIQTIRALAVLGNGGYLVTPHLVKQINYDIGVTKKIEVTPGQQVIKKETSEEITRMLVTVVDKALRGGTYRHDRYSIAAKTGTAQLANPDGGGYYKDRYLHSFFGYFPAYDPQFLILLYAVDPKGVNYASETFTKPFMNLADFLINYYQIPPDR
ncbi:MAG: penicillin-binding protein 2 [Minisyncoccia bacterium]